MVKYGGDLILNRKRADDNVDPLSSLCSLLSGVDAFDKDVDKGDNSSGDKNPPPRCGGDEWECEEFADGKPDHV